MKTCKKCGETFPNRIRIDGKEKMLCNRKFCLKCSPWGKHNTRRLDLPAKQREKIDTWHLYQKNVRDERKKKLVELKGGGCLICSYSKCNGCLDFHHIDPSEKKFALSTGQLANHSWEDILVEADKTILLCRNCHGEVHAGLHKEKAQFW